MVDPLDVSYVIYFPKIMLTTHDPVKWLHTNRVTYIYIYTCVYTYIHIYKKCSGIDMLYTGPSKAETKGLLILQPPPALARAKNGCVAG